MLHGYREQNKPDQYGEKSQEQHHSARTTGRCAELHLCTHKQRQSQAVTCTATCLARGGGGGGNKRLMVDLLALQRRHHSRKLRVCSRVSPTLDGRAAH
jgi:hypothetical protein